MAKGARDAVTLGGAKEGDIWRGDCIAYGRNLAIEFQVFPTVVYVLFRAECADQVHAYQLVDDSLDYESASTMIGNGGAI